MEHSDLIAGLIAMRRSMDSLGCRDIPPCPTCGDSDENNVDPETGGCKRCDADEIENEKRRRTGR